MELRDETFVFSYPRHLPALKRHYQWRQVNEDSTYDQMKESPEDLTLILKQMVLRIP